MNISGSGCRSGRSFRVRTPPSKMPTRQRVISRYALRRLGLTICISCNLSYRPMFLLQTWIGYSHDQMPKGCHAQVATARIMVFPSRSSLVKCRSSISRISHHSCQCPDAPRLSLLVAVGPFCPSLTYPLQEEYAVMMVKRSCLI